MMRFWRCWVGILAPVVLIGCHGEAHYAAGPPPPPPPPAEPPLGAPPPTFANDQPPPRAPEPSSAPAVDPNRAPTGAQPQSSTADSQASAQAPSQKQAGPLPPLPSQAPAYGSPQPVPPPENAPSTEAPSASQWVRPYPDGQWVYTADYGWIWVPAGTTTSAVEDVPYAYIYTPRFGWTWYLSPWGWGPYHYGVWVSHPWRPYGWHHGWVAHPHVAVRLGHRHR